MAPNLCLQWVLEPPDGSIRSSPSVVEGVRPRRPHKKSRHGCVMCKQRRKKCDEMHPACSQCLQMRLRCAYPSRQSELGSAKTLAHGKRQLSMSRDDARRHLLQAMDVATEGQQSAATPDLGHADILQLLDHFLNESSPWMGSPAYQKVLQNHGMKLAIEAPHFLHAILSFSASHIDYLHPNPRFRITAVQHCNRLLALYNASLDKLGTDNVTHLFGTCTLLSMLVYVGIAYDNREADEDPYNHECDFDSFRTLQGSKVLQGVPALRDQLRRSFWSQMLLDAERSEEPDTCDATILPPSEWPSSVMKGLCAFCNVSVDLKSGDIVYLDALRSFNKLIHLKMDHNSIDQLMKFVASLSPAFLHDLERFDPKAMTILAYWHAFMLQTGQWWIVRTALGATRRSCVYLWDLGIREIRQLLEFPATQCGLDLDPTRGIQIRVHKTTTHFPGIKADRPSGLASRAEYAPKID